MRPAWPKAACGPTRHNMPCFPCWKACAAGWNRTPGARSACLRGFSPSRWHPQGALPLGGVGRGKSMVMDLFVEHLDMPQKRRVHSMPSCRKSTRGCTPPGSGVWMMRCGPSPMPWPRKSACLPLMKCRSPTSPMR
ncbi:AFG1/ZapE family ATPase [Gemmobacter lanyuensis]